MFIISNISAGKQPLSRYSLLEHGEHHKYNQQLITEQHHNQHNYSKQLKVKSSQLYLYSAFNNTNCNKALHNIK